MPSSPQSQAHRTGNQCDGTQPAEKRKISLPIMADGGSPIRPSKSGKRRAIVLLLVHVLVLAHVLHWLRTGRTISPVEPSEAMETIKLGRINAGFIFFAITILATLILGRWLCGWGCHLVAYQDFTLWLLKKLHLRPKAFRTRLLIFIPLVAAFYMFLWPAVYRLFVGIPSPPLTWHVTRAGFWDTFPEYGVAILTILTCGVAIIYFLGPKGFCTYACPYGAFFGAVDKLAVARIRVTDACHQCGHCTAVCTSNVDVAQEVKLYKMVVDPGCMKCMDCVSVCPNDALYFGFGKPALGAASVAPPRPRKYDLSVGEELIALALFAGAFLAYRGLYGRVPFLMSLGWAGMTAYLLMKAGTLFYRRDALLQKIVLKSDGRLRRAGMVFACGVLLLSAFTAHSGLWRYHQFMGQQLAAQLPPEAFGWQRAPGYIDRLSEADRQAVRTGLGHFSFCEQWGLLSTIDEELQLAWMHLLNQNSDEATRRMKHLADTHAQDAGYWLQLANLQTYLRSFDDARNSFAHALELEKAERELLRSKLPNEPVPASALVWAEWGAFLADRGETAAAQDALKKAVEFDGDSAAAWLAMGAFEYGHHQIDAARASLARALLLNGGAPQAAELLNQLCREDQDFTAALNDYDFALSAEPTNPVLQSNRAHALARLGRYDEGAIAYRSILKNHPDQVRARAELGAILLATGDLGGAIAEYEAVTDKLPNESEAHFKLGFLYQQAGRPNDAAKQYQIVIKLGGPEKDLARQGLESLHQGK